MKTKEQTIHSRIKHRVQRFPLQTRISASLYERVNVKREREGITWRALIEACLEEYLEESADKKAG